MKPLWTGAGSPRPSFGGEVREMHVVEDRGERGDEERLSRQGVSSLRAGSYIVVAFRDFPHQKHVRIRYGAAVDRFALSSGPKCFAISRVLWFQVIGFETCCHRQLLVCSSHHETLKLRIALEKIVPRGNSDPTLDSSTNLEQTARKFC